jgi:hypothetical protein
VSGQSVFDALQKQTISALHHHQSTRITQTLTSNTYSITMWQLRAAVTVRTACLQFLLGGAIGATDEMHQIAPKISVRSLLAPRRTAVMAQWGTCVPPTQTAATRGGPCDDTACDMQAWMHHVTARLEQKTLTCQEEVPAWQRYATNAASPVAPSAHVWYNCPMTLPRCLKLSTVTVLGTSESINHRTPNP